MTGNPVTHDWTWRHRGCVTVRAYFFIKRHRGTYNTILLCSRTVIHGFFLKINTQFRQKQISLKCFKAEQFLSNMEIEFQLYDFRELWNWNIGQYWELCVTATATPTKMSLENMFVLFALLRGFPILHEYSFDHKCPLRCMYIFTR